jgi:ribosomal protein S18 acetylase RimI-like enzyme
VTVDGLTFRRPTADDHPRIVANVDEWWGGRPLRSLLPRLWLEHFTGTSWIAERADGRLAGFIVGFISPDDPTTAYAHMIGSDPNLRRAGIGRALYERFFADAREAGRTSVTAITWPANRLSLAFHKAIGFEVQRDADSRNLYGTPSQAGYDFEREDRAILVRAI